MKKYFFIIVLFVVFCLISILNSCKNDTHCEPACGEVREFAVDATHYYLIVEDYNGKLHQICVSEKDWNRVYIGEYKCAENINKKINN